jgi:predicted porin
MKKSLFALAALGAFAGAAQAQSSVTLYGAMDASVQAIQNGGVDPTASTANKTITSSTNTPSTANATPVLVDGAIATSVWGLKGTEDLGGGMKAMFEAESDLLINNGTTHSSGLFRRAANVGVGGSWGSVYLGLRGNPLAAASSANFAMGGNTVHQIRSAIGYNSTDFIKNGIQYESPNMGGIVARAAYGMSNTVGDSSDGSILAGSLVYEASGLRLSAAYNKANAGLASGTTLQQSVTNYTAATPAGTNSCTTASPPVCTFTGTANSAAALSSTYAMFASAANTIAFDQMGWILGAKYNFASLGMPKLTASYGLAHSELTAYTVAAGATTFTTAKTANANASMLGLAYQATPMLALGANYIVTTADSTLTNLQARYSLSKRTTTYFQASVAKNGAGSWSDGSAFGNMMPTNTNSSSNAVIAGAGTANVGGYGLVSGSTFSGGLPNTTSSAFGVGVIHNF